MTSNGMPIVKILFSDIIKFFLATIVLLLGFLWKWDKVGETQELLFFQDYLSQEDSETSIEIEEQKMHPAPDIQDECKKQDPLCKKIETLEEEKIIPYKNQIYTATYFINDNQIIKKKIVDTIKKITIKDDETEKRWYATRDTIVLNIWPTNWLKEFQNLSSHELGHIFDLWVMQWNKSSKNRSFTEFNKIVFSTNDPSLLFYSISRTSENIRKKDAVKKEFCSGYWMTNPFEDFAECFNLYINNQSFFRFIATKNKNLAHKYNFIATLLKGKYLEKNTQAISLLKWDSSRRPRDTTKL